MSALASLLAEPQTRPCSSSAGLGLVTSDTNTITTASARKAMIACQKLALSGEPKWKIVL